MKTKLSRAILLASVALLSVVGAAVAFSTNRAINNQLMASDVEALADWEGFADWWNNKCYKVDRKEDCTEDVSYGIAAGLSHGHGTHITGIRYFCLNAGYNAGAFAHCPVNPRLCLIPGITRRYEKIKEEYENYYRQSQYSYA